MGDELNNTGVCETLAAHGYAVNICGFSAIDRYLGWDSLPFVLIETGADLSDLARHFEGIRFPGASLADGAVEQNGRCYFFRCLDPEDVPRPSYKFLGFNQDWKTRRFRDPWGFYPLLRQIRDGDAAMPYGIALPNAAPPVKPRENSSNSIFNRGLTLDLPPPWWEGLDRTAGYWRAAMDGALILARYSLNEDPRYGEINQIVALILQLPKGPPPGGEEQRTLLMGLLSSPHPGFGLELLKASGFIGELWPELALLDDVDHSKEFHPEGNVWKHTIETFRYRKTAVNSRTTATQRVAAIPKMAFDFRLSLALLLHDVGKPISASSGSHRFEGHAEIGARQARKFLERLGFERPLIEDIYYLVKNHMLPAALPRLPLIRTQEIMESPLFPTLMELYRCDESSSFKGLDGYYESSAAYQTYLRNRRNPYRSADGKKLGRREMINSHL
jgi:poly(A) polymerase